MSRVLDWWSRDRETGRIVLFQFPNPPLWVFAAAYATRWFTGPDLDEKLRLIGSGALMVWGLDEVVRGANPLRRALGAVVLTWQIVQLAAS